MRNMIKAAIIAFGAAGALAVPASAQPYGGYGDNGGYGPGYGEDPGYGQGYSQDPNYDPNYAPGYAQGYGDEGYCDPSYGCPD